MKQSIQFSTDLFGCALSVHVDGRCCGQVVRVPKGYVWATWPAIATELHEAIRRGELTDLPAFTGAPTTLERAIAEIVAGAVASKLTEAGG